MSYKITSDMVEAFEPCPNCAALEKRLAVAEHLLTRWVKLLSCDYRLDLKAECQAFLANSLGDYVAVRREDLQLAIAALAYRWTKPKAFNRLKAALGSEKEGSPLSPAPPQDTPGEEPGD